MTEVGRGISAFSVCGRGAHCHATLRKVQVLQRTADVLIPQRREGREAFPTSAPALRWPAAARMCSAGASTSWSFSKRRSTWCGAEKVGARRGRQVRKSRVAPNRPISQRRHRCCPRRRLGRVSAPDDCIVRVVLKDTANLDSVTSRALRERKVRPEIREYRIRRQ